MRLLRRCQTWILVLVLVGLEIISVTGCSALTDSANGSVQVSHCGDNPLNQEGALRVGVRYTIPNFSNYNKQTGKYYGLEVDLAAELAERLGYDKLELVNTSAQTREDDLVSGRLDVILALYTPTEERKQLVDFSPAYYVDSEQLIIERSTQFSSLADLKGMSIAVHEDTSNRSILTDLMVENGIYDSSEEADSQMDFVTYELYPNMFDAIETGQVDALIVDGSIASAYMNEDREVLHYLTDTEYCAGTKKDSELSELVSQAISNMLEDGTIDDLKTKWSTGS